MTKKGITQKQNGFGVNKSHTERNHKIGKWNKGATKVGITKCECYKQNRPMFYVNLVHGSMRRKVRNIFR